MQQRNQLLLFKVCCLCSDSHPQIYRGRKNVRLLWCNLDPASLKLEQCPVNSAGVQHLYWISSVIPGHTHNCCSPTEHHLSGMMIFSYKLIGMMIALERKKKKQIWQSGLQQQMGTNLMMQQKMMRQSYWPTSLYKSYNFPAFFYWAVKHHYNCFHRGTVEEGFAESAIVITEEQL